MICTSFNRETLELQRDAHRMVTNMNLLTGWEPPHRVHGITLPLSGFRF